MTDRKPHTQAYTHTDTQTSLYLPRLCRQAVIVGEPMEGTVCRRLSARRAPED